MKINAKPALIIVGTLIIGMALGALTQSVVMRRRFDKLRHMRGRGELSQRLVESIGPMDAAQRAAVTAEFNRTAAQIDSAIQAGRRQVDAILDSAATRVDSLLTPEQQQRLHRELGKRFHGPGPGGPPPMFGGPPPMPHDGGPPPDGHRPDGPPH